MGKGAYGETLAHYRNGSGDDNEANLRIAKVWKELIESEGGEIARTLGIPQTVLDPGEAPYRAEPGKSGVTGVELVVVFGGAAAIGFVKELGAAAGKGVAKKLEEVWTKHMERRVNDPKDRLLGTRVDDKDG